MLAMIPNHAVLLFDFDGVLADTRDDLLFFAARVSAQLGYPRQPTPADLEALELMNFDEFARQLQIPETQVKEFSRRSVELFMSRSQPPDLFPGLGPVIKRISAVHSAGIVTANTSGVVRGFLDYHELTPCFKVIVGADAPGSKPEKIKTALRKFGVAGEFVYMIGDAVSDIRAARQAGVKSIAVTWGHQSERKLSSALPDYLVRSPVELEELFKNHVSKDV
jgi:phosphoglycolate phosphatase